jgi:hypothetical protein
MLSRALLTKLNCLDFLVLKGHPTIKFVFAKFCRYHCTTKQFVATFCKSEKPVLHLEPPCLKNIF